MGKYYTKPWYDRYSGVTQNKKVIIIGGGISGAATAYSLARRGYQVTLYEQNSALALEASGNYQAILYGHFAGNYNSSLELSLSGYRYSYNLITSILKDNYQESGIIELIDNEYKLRQILRNNFADDFCYPVDHEQIENLANIKVNSKCGIYYPSGIWLNPSAFINELVCHPNIKIVLNSAVNNIEFTNKWWIKTTSCIIDSTATLVLCNSHNLNNFTYCQNIPLLKTRGQTTIVKGNLGLKTIICGKGYITPNRGDSYTIGATFKNDISDMGVNELEHRENIAQISGYFHNLDINLNELDGQANIRAHTIDHLPLVGPIADYEKFKQTYALLAKDANYKLTAPCPYLPGLYVNAGFGSKGILFAPICAEIIANYIDGTQFAVSESLRQALHPHRFWIRDIIKNK
jgi:tRNA 5-methylaminomethyl-2-thiouridine biosynthesis bifunctional protein